jgi:plasmid stability protein
MAQVKNRKEVTLDDQTMPILKIKAAKKGRNLKNYMEQILKEKANEFEVTEEYKTIMDALLEKHYSGEMNYISEEEFRKRTARR